MFKELNGMAINDLDWTMISGIAALISLFIVPILKSLTNLALSIRGKSEKEKDIIRELNSELDNLLNYTQYMQYIRTSRSKTLNNIPFINIYILLKKNINYKELIDIIYITNKNLCFYVPITKKIQLVSEKEYKKIKNNDVFLHLYFYMGLLFLMIFTYFLFQSLLVKTILFQKFSINEMLLPNRSLNITAMAILYVIPLIFEVLWLFRKNPYDSYKSLKKNTRTSEYLAKLNIIVSLK